VHGVKIRGKIQALNQKKMVDCRVEMRQNSVAKQPEGA
jgi:hypothetical protein